MTTTTTTEKIHANAPAISAEFHDFISGKVIFSLAAARRGDKTIATVAELDSWLAAAAERHGATAGACVAIDCDDAAYGAACRLLELAGFEPENTNGNCACVIYDRNC